MVDLELVRYIEEQLTRVHSRHASESFQHWKTRKNAEHDAQQKQADKETKLKYKTRKNRVENLIFSYFAAFLSGEMVPWNHKLSGRGFAKYTVADTVKHFDLHNHADIFGEAEVEKPFEERTDEEILDLLSEFLPGKVFHVDTVQNNMPVTHELRIKRMMKK